MPAGSPDPAGGPAVRHGDRWRTLLALPPHRLARVVAAKLAERAKHAALRRLDGHRATWAASPGPLGGVIGGLPEATGDRLLRAIAQRHIDNRFDVLGSGWVEAAHGAPVPGFAGIRHDGGLRIEADPAGDWLAPRVTPANLPEARRIWRLVGPGYRPIDWQRDLRSGYRWHERTWYRDVAIAPARGADIKVPWELGRMQHLPRLAAAFAAARGEGDDGFAAACLGAFRNQVLDFAAANPPRFGVQWSSSMDVGLRAVSWLLALDLFRAAGAVFDPPFLDVVAAAVRAHGRHVRANLERSATFRGNHYLANLTGLVCIAARLPASRESDGWLGFAVPEFRREVARQFHAEGAHFEASTAYHRLCGEMAALGTAFVLGLPAERLRVAGLALPAVDDADLERLERMAVFAIRTTRPDGRMMQVGDNDSGCCLRLTPLPEAGEGDLQEDLLDPRPFVAMVAGLVPRPDLLSFAAGAERESRLVAALAGDRRPAPAWPAPVPRDRAGSGDRAALEAAWSAAPASRRRIQRVPLPPDPAPVQAAAFPDFGLYCLSRPGLFVAIRCGRLDADGNGGHAHADQLAVELAVGGVPVWSDPGSFCYTPIPELRQAYRSASAHHVPRPAGAGEPVRLDLGLFRLVDRSDAECLSFDVAGFAGRHRGYGFTVCRAVVVAEDALNVIDWIADDEGAAPDSVAWLDPEPLPFSRGYGLR